MQRIFRETIFRKLARCAAIYGFDETNKLFPMFHGIACGEALTVVTFQRFASDFRAFED